jgi:hypothetical protein
MNNGKQSRTWEDFKELLPNKYRTNAELIPPKKYGELIQLFVMRPSLIGNKPEPNRLAHLATNRQTVQPRFQPTWTQNPFYDPKEDSQTPFYDSKKDHEVLKQKPAFLRKRFPRVTNEIKKYYA